MSFAVMWGLSPETHLASLPMNLHQITFTSIQVFCFSAAEGLMAGVKWPGPIECALGGLQWSRAAWVAVGDGGDFAVEPMYPAPKVRLAGVPDALELLSWL
jgi:hypothetical protein